MDVTEIVRRHAFGVLVAPEHPVAMATVIRELAADPTRRVDMGKRGQRSAELIYTNAGWYFCGKG